uniref:Uncharacterized protein n=1 Tax=Siphoviridae sp. ctxMM9 TaxID=2827973 RepID=A0A8S5T6R7_9CAUD|nr:MAG TPA: hypothetical protein [Siphoviridae sp. ctxMM9]
MNLLAGLPLQERAYLKNYLMKHWKQQRKRQIKNYQKLTIILISKKNSFNK